MNPQRFLAFTLLLLAPAAFSFANASSHSDSDLLERKVSVMFNDVGGGSVLQHLSYKANIPLGFETIFDPPGVAGKRVSLKVKEGSVRDVLDAFVAADRRYKWEVTDGVINVTPKEPQNNIGDVRIFNFFAAEADIFDLGLAVTWTPEVLARIESLGLKPAGGVKYSGRPQPKTRHTVTLPEMSVREVLNEMLRRGYAKYWHITSSGERNEYVRAFLLY